MLDIIRYGTCVDVLAHHEELMTQELLCGAVVPHCILHDRRIIAVQNASRVVRKRLRIQVEVPESGADEDGYRDDLQPADPHVHH